MNQTPEELISRLALTPHPENGAFAERHYPHSGLERAASGAIYYYVAPDEKTEFHRIDCDEYWCYAAGETLDVWVIDPNGCLTVTRLGITPDAEPILYVKKGDTFASRHRDPVTEGTFLSCITVPRFTYDGFEMFTEAEAREKFPACAPFFDA